MTATITPTSTVDSYFEAWNTADGPARLAAVASCFTPDARYCDPLSDASGHDGIASMMGTVRDQHPGLSLRLASDVDTHHDVARFAWEAVDASGNVTVAGIDVVRLSPDDGRIASLYGFFG